MSLDDVRTVLTEQELTYKVYYLVCFWLESLLYGLYFCMFIAALNIMLRKRTWDQCASRVFLIGTITLFILISFHNTLNVYRMVTAYAYQIGPPEAVDFIRNTDNWDAFALPVILALVVWVADILVIYRCYLVWSRSYLVVSLPILLLLASIGTHSVNLWWFGHRSSRTHEEMQPLFNSTFPLHLLQNIITTGLIAYRIWNQHRVTQRAGVMVSGAVSLLTVIRIVVESALLYTLQMLLANIMFFIKHPAQVILQHALIPTTGIVFVLVAIRAHSSRRSSEARDTLRTNSLIPSWIHGSEDTDEDMYATQSQRTTPNITTVIEQHQLGDLSTSLGRSTSGSMFRANNGKQVLAPLEEEDLGRSDSKV